MTVLEYLSKQNIYIDEEERIHVSVLCDSTAIFLMELEDALEQFGCTNIKYGGYVDKEHVPKNKPWCSYRYTVSGELPTNIKEDMLKCWDSVPHDIKERLSKMYNNEEEKWTH